MAVQEHTYAFSTDFNSGEFMYFDEKGLASNLLLRAEGYVYPVENTPVATVGPERDALPEFYSYKVWRAKGYNPAETDWTEVNGTVSSTSIIDSAWGTLAAGVYSYAVASVYPDGSMSARAVSPYILNNVYSTLSVAVTTNSYSADPSGATVTVTDHDGRVVASAHVDEEESVV